MPSFTDSPWGADSRPGYEHTQRGWLHWILAIPVLVMLVSAALVRNEPWIVVLLLLVAGLLTVLSFMFRELSVIDQGDHLLLKYGPLPLFTKRIDYIDVAAVAPGRSSWIDGWGIHYVPGRGWTYNLWGFDCVVLTLAGGRTLRIGTDDPQGLARFIGSQTSGRN